MRLIGSVKTQQEAEQLSSHLKTHSIENRIEVLFDPQDGHLSYQIWAHNEDQIVEATTLFHNFQPCATPPPAPAAKDPSRPFRRPTTPCTLFMLSLCCLIFLFNMLEQVPLRKEGLSEKTILFTPVQALLLFEVPPPYEKLQKVIEQHTSDSRVKDLSPQVKADLRSIETTPFWRGGYPWVLFKLQGKNTALVEGAFLTKIRSGEVWRLFTPCLLHGNLLHILFNMLWLWVLGRPIEQRLGLCRTVVLTLTVGIGSNFAQYLMSGPFFLGYSGVVLGLAGFIWMRERIAPWEGYPLTRPTFLFLLFFIGAMFALQLASFLLQAFANISFEPNIANTAHIVGALIGIGLARLPYFSWRAR